MSLAVSACTSEDTLTEPSTEASSARAAGKTYRAVDLGTLGGNFSQAFGISPAGQVVGWSSTAEGDFHAFLWEKGIMTDLGALFGGDGVATGINPAGHVVGHSAGHVFLWSKGIITDLGTLGGSHAFASGINPAGQVVGTSATTAEGGFYAFLWHKGIKTNLGTL